MWLRFIGLWCMPRHETSSSLWLHCSSKSISQTHYLEDACSTFWEMVKIYKYHYSFKILALHVQLHKHSSLIRIATHYYRFVEVHEEYEHTCWQVQLSKIQCFHVLRLLCFSIVCLFCFYESMFCKSLETRSHGFWSGILCVPRKESFNWYNTNVRV